METLILTPELGVVLAHELCKCMELANVVSRKYGCVQHVNFDCQHATYYVSDWYENGATVYTVENGIAN